MNKKDQKYLNENTCPFCQEPISKDTEVSGENYQCKGCYSVFHYDGKDWKVIKQCKVIKPMSIWKNFSRGKSIWKK